MRRAVLVALAACAAFAAAVAILRRGRPQPPPAPPEGTEPAEGVVSERSLDALTRDELYELARAQDIPGRSRMKKDELRDALRRA
jgi:hypothetical protein